MKTYWRSIEELANPKEIRRIEVRAEAKQKSMLMRGDDQLSESSRRDFLKTFGFSIAAATIIAGCARPINKAIPYVVKPIEMDPGTADFYASSYFDANEYGSIVVKVRDGRPIKIEGNTLSSITQGGTSARIQASVLNLYDDARFKGPLKSGSNTSWEKADEEIIFQLARLKRENGKIVLLTSTIISPSTRKIIQQFIEKQSNVEWIQYDAGSVSGLLQANQLSFGMPLIPDYQFDKAKVVVSFGADFLGTWLSTLEYTRGYTTARQLQNGQTEMLRHYQFEAGMTLTGSNADVRFPIKPSEEGAIVLALYNAIARAKGGTVVSGVQTSVEVSELAKDVLQNEKQSIVLSGSNDVNIQLLVNGINQLLGNYGTTIGLENPLQTKQGIDQDMDRLLGELKAGSVKALLVWGVNPVYDHPQGIEFAEGIRKTELSISFSERPDETTALCMFSLPETNFLESWNDLEPKAGIYSLAQPTIAPLFNARAPQETLLKWTGINLNYHNFIQNFWKETQFSQQKEITDFIQFWNTTLQRGVYETSQSSKLKYSPEGIVRAAGQIKNASPGIEVALYESIALGNGKYANNPWLQELPDPMAKLSWDNFAAIPVAYAEENGLKNEDVIKVNGIQLPVFVQPGQAKDTISVALGYGREIAGKVGNKVGTNLYPSVENANGSRQYHITSAKVEKVPGKTFELAISQTHYLMEGRPIVRETTLLDYVKNPSSGNELHAINESKSVTLYKEPHYNGHHWGMAVDLNSCTGCGACTIACQAENNIQVIGKDQVRNRRIMHWIRIDRYYSENPENPKVSFQPVMCQHCGNAPCENVCPVAATPHSEEGLNQMAYNRCVGTKYCLNNCPYKVRRFNWFQYVKNNKFDYASNSDLGRMVLNPDVTVRSRGVVEKCSMCVQRIQAKKQQAKLEGRPIADGEFQTACAQSCPGNAIVFGDLANPDSRLSKLFQDKRNYHLLEELHTLPSVGYLTKVRNTSA
ncbi:MAG TPA: molybdopterin oxidoreductase [Prolixibacteraceae bacterium]|jgi:molybdopterin-containing oxidoreductase family iron-sulfur binding subunit|nr:molybdopterin oxidoreductase [Prolixibacteraceae bacterium]